MIEQRQGNLLEARTEAIVNTVNTVGVMGKGVALQFKRRYPSNFKAYSAACKAGEVQIGRMFVTELPPSLEPNPRYIINFPTKKHWRGDSKLEYVRAGLQDLIHTIKEREIRSVALPALGCGNGGLQWAEVLPLIEAAFAKLPEVQVALYPPEQAPEPVADTLRPRTKKPDLTPGRALMVKLFELYLLPDYTLGRTEAQKLAYFLQEAGQDMRLDFVKHTYGPYTPAVWHVLEHMEGHYIRGLGSGEGASRITLLPGAADEAAHVIEGHPESHTPLERVATLIEGFETTYSLEVLASVHWVATREGARTLEEARDSVYAWNDRKRERLDPDHLGIAWEHLQQHGWLPLQAKSVN